VESGGEFAAFEDERMQWALPRLGIEGKTVLELGPLEGGHTWMIEQAGASGVTAVEANQRAFLKCLVTREVMGMTRSRFLHGDVTEYLRSTDDAFHACVASGILYHLRDPVELISLLADRAERLFVWTHYYDAERMTRRQRRRFGRPVEARVGGFEHTLHARAYGAGRRFRGFPGGSGREANWLSRQGLLDSLAHFGWEVEELAFDKPLDEAGPSLALLAVRRSGGEAPHPGR
jgi:hypothetical protein